jgi:hypothetical protein
MDHKIACDKMDYNFFFSRRVFAEVRSRAKFLACSIYTFQPHSVHLLANSCTSPPVISRNIQGVFKIFWTDAVKIMKLTIRPIGRHHPRSSSLPHVDTGPTVSSIFGSPFLSECQADDPLLIS